MDEVSDFARGAGFRMPRCLAAELPSRLGGTGQTVDVYDYGTNSDGIGFRTYAIGIDDQSNIHEFWDRWNNLGYEHRRCILYCDNKGLREHLLFSFRPHEELDLSLMSVYDAFCSFKGAEVIELKARKR